MINDWGYETPDDLAPLLTTEGFALHTRGMFSATDDEVAAAIDAVTAAARDWCGWHIGPPCPCKWTGDGVGRMVRLPAMHVRSIDRVEVLGRVIDESEYQWRGSGLVRFSFALPDAWRSVRIEFTAGAEALAASAVIAQIASNALAASPGVASESAGQVSISYNKPGDGVSGGYTLLGRDRDLLSPWRLPRDL